MASPTAPDRPRKPPRALPLRPLELHGAPCSKRAVAWSPDGELAVAVDDSVYVHVPQWGDGVEAEGLVGGERPARDTAAATATAAVVAETATRGQFVAGSRRIPVAFPRVEACVNDRLFEGHERLEGVDDDEENDEENAGEGGGPGPVQVHGPGSTMHSVVHLAWSPTGVGRYQRAILGVLSAGGMLAVYGAGPGGDGTGGYGTERWAVLWAVGGRAQVPLRPESVRRRRQQPDCIVSFAWTESVAVDDSTTTTPTTLLVYVTEGGEVVVVSVGRHREDERWRIVEEGRFDARGPHATLAERPPPESLPGHPHYMPCGTAFGVACSPWLVEHRGTTLVQTCLVAYLARGYVGFRRLAVQTAGMAGAVAPSVLVDHVDTDGLCLFLGTDAFVVWEPGIWGEAETTDADGRPGLQRDVCRGIVATPMVAKAFSIPLAWMDTYDALPEKREDDEDAALPHSQHVCGTVYPPPDEQRTNPIQDLVVFAPPDPVRRSPAPYYALVRLSATTTGGDWFETNVPDADPPSWADDVARTIQASEPDRILVVDDDDDEMDVDMDPLPKHTTTAKHRVRLWGLALAPGGGSRAVTAVVATEHPTEHPDRGGWYRDHSRVLFGTSVVATGDLPVDGDDDNTLATHFRAPPLSTEARMWAWMYSGGQDPASSVAGAFTAPEHHRPDPRPAAACVPTQSCSICGATITDTNATSSTLACARGHVFDRCAATGIAIQQPGVSRACGVCGRRTLRIDALGFTLPDTLVAALQGDTCGRCGGKFHG